MISLLKLQGRRLSCGVNCKHLSFSLSVHSFLECCFRHISLSQFHADLMNKIQYFNKRIEAAIQCISNSLVAALKGTYGAGWLKMAYSVQNQPWSEYFFTNKKINSRSTLLHIMWMSTWSACMDWSPNNKLFMKEGKEVLPQAIDNKKLITMRKIKLISAS